MDQLPTSPRLTFRRMHADDLDDVARLLGDPVVMEHYPRPRTRAEAADWIAVNQRRYADDGYGLWAVHDREGRFVGDCGLTWQVVDGVADLEVGYHLVPDRWGEGLATEAAAACRDLAAARGVRRLVAIVRPGNARSVAVAQRIGLALERTGTMADLPVEVYAAALEPA